MVDLFRSKGSRSVRFGAALAAIVLFSLTVKVSHAQDFDRYRPKTPENTQGAAQLPKAPKEAAGDTKVLVDSLLSLVLVDHPDKVGTAGAVDRGLHIASDQGLELLRSGEFQQRISAYLNRPVSLRHLNELVREIIIFYRENDQPVVDVSVPQQDITDGIIYVVILEGRVGKVCVEGSCFFEPYILACQPCISAGDSIYESLLMQDLRWLNRNPFRRVDMELTPGSEFGETDVIFKVKDERPVRYYVGYEDTGTQQTGPERFITGMNWGNAFGRDHQAGFQYTSSFDFQTIQAYSGVYEIPLLNHDTILIYGSYADIRTGAPPAGVVGKAWQTSIRYNRDLCWEECFQNRIFFGFDFKQTNTNLEFGGDMVFNTTADIAQLMVGYNSLRSDCRGTTLLNAELFVSPGGGFSPGNNDIDFGTIRSGATSDYVYTRLVGERQIWLPHCLTFVARVTGQIAEGNLLPSEQLGFGGYHTIRGYDMRGVNGDSGYFANLEIRTDPIPLCLGRCEEDELQLLTFYDVGDSRNHTLLVGEDPSIDLNSVGVGMRYRLGRKLHARVDYGWQLNDLTLGTVDDSRWHVGIIMSR